MSKSGSSSTSTTTIDPDLKKSYQENLEQAQKVALALPDRKFADINALYKSGEEKLVNTAIAGPGISTTNSAAEYANQAAQFQPYYTGGINAGMSNQAGATGYTPGNVTAAQANMANIGNYLNPFTEQVIKNNLGDIESSRQTAVQQMGEAATRAKAFGGSRQGVAEGATNKAYADKAAQMSADLRMKGFDTSANLMQQDLTRQQQANLQQSQQGATAGQFSAGAVNAATLQNASQGNEMQKFNANLAQQSDLANQQAYGNANTQRLAAAGQLGSLGQQQQTMGLTGAKAVMDAGAARQQLTQQELDAKRNIGLEKLGITQGAMSTALPNAGGSTSTPTYNNSLASALGGAGYGYQFGGLPGAAVGSIVGLLGR